MEGLQHFLEYSSILGLLEPRQAQIVMKASEKTKY